MIAQGKKKLLHSILTCTSIVCMKSGPVAALLTALIHKYFFVYLCIYTLYWTMGYVMLFAIFTFCILKLNTIQGDPKEIVVDEILGQSITILLIIVACKIFMYNIPAFSMLYNDLITNKYSIQTLLISVCYLSFVVLDVSKPGIIGKIDKYHKTKWSILLDDIVAGLCASIISFTIIVVYGHWARYYFTT